MLRNLLSNAFKYGGGSIVVTLARMDGETPGAEDLVLTVDDEGPGLGPAGLVRVFEPFERGARAGDGQGLGLGLALSRRIALALGGTLGAEDRSSGGARFTFRFPLLPAPPTPLGPSAAHTVPALRILVAEDVPLVRRVIVAILNSHGHEVTEAEDGLEAAALLDALEFDLAFLDLGMPGLDGLEVVARLVASARGQGLPPLILLTASGDEAIGARALAAGFASVLRKPVSGDELRDAVTRVYASRRGASAVESSFASQMSILREEAREDLVRRISTLLDSAPQGADAAEAHRIAGLAAQFGWPGVAAAADAVEQAASSGRTPPQAALALLAQASQRLS